MTDEMPTLALLAGLLCDTRVWQPVAAQLPDRFPHANIAFPGFRSIEAMAAHVLATVPGPLIPVGHSMGGRVALEIVRQAPARVAGLVLANTGIHPPAPEEAAGRQKLVDIATGRGMAALADAWLPPMMGAAPERVAELMPELLAMVAANSVESYTGQIAALLNRPDATPVLANYRGPLLLLCADGDRWSPPAQHERMRALAPHGRLAIVSQAGHMVPVEKPGVVARLIGTWLDGHWPA